MAIYPVRSAETGAVTFFVGAKSDQEMLPEGAAVVVCDGDRAAQKRATSYNESQSWAALAQFVVATFDTADYSEDKDGKRASQVLSATEKALKHNNGELVVELYKLMGACMARPKNKGE